MWATFDMRVSQEWFKTRFAEGLSRQWQLKPQALNPLHSKLHRDATRNPVGCRG